MQHDCGPPSCRAEPGQTRACEGLEAQWASPGARGGTGSAGCHKVARGPSGGPVVPETPGEPVCPRVARVSGSLGVPVAPETEVQGVPGDLGGPLAVKTGTRSPPQQTQTPGT